MKLLLAALYTALSLGANAAIAQNASIEALRSGDMRKLQVHAAPKPVSAAPFVHAEDGAEGELGLYRGKFVLLNFWATWCVPCRKEMPMLSALQRDFSGPRFEVVTLATGRNTPQGIKRLFAKHGIDNLPAHRDPKQAVAKAMAVLGLPVTVIINPAGLEIARLTGDADWAGPDARAIISALLQSINDADDG